MSGKFVGTVVPGQGLIGAVLLEYLDPGYRGAGFVGYLAADPDIYVRRPVHDGRWFSVFLFFAGRREPEQRQQQERQAFFDAFFHGGSGIVVATRNIGNKSEFAKSRIIFIFASQSQKR